MRPSKSILVYYCECKPKVVSPLTVPKANFSYKISRDAATGERAVADQKEQVRRREMKLYDTLPRDIDYLPTMRSNRALLAKKEKVSSYNND
jgi:hypothetical protein